MSNIIQLFLSTWSLKYLDPTNTNDKRSTESIGSDKPGEVIWANFDSETFYYRMVYPDSVFYRDNSKLDPFLYEGEDLYKLRDETLNRTYHAQGKCCCYCGSVVHRDHVEPVTLIPSEIGDWVSENPNMYRHPANIGLACAACMKVKVGVLYSMQEYAGYKLAYPLDFRDLFVSLEPDLANYLKLKQIILDNIEETGCCECRRSCSADKMSPKLIDTRNGRGLDNIELLCGRGACNLKYMKRSLAPTWDVAKFVI